MEFLDICSFENSFFSQCQKAGFLHSSFALKLTAVVAYVMQHLWKMGDKF